MILPIWRAKCRHMDLRTEVRFGDDSHDEPRPYCPQCDGFLTWTRWELIVVQRDGRGILPTSTRLRRVK